MTPMLAMAECRMRDAGLSKRERHVAWCILAGMSTDDIGDTLDIENTTVKTHLTRAFKKFGFSGAHDRKRTQMVFHLLMPTDWELAAITARTDREVAW